MLHSLALILFAGYIVLFKLLHQGAIILVACSLLLPRFRSALCLNIRSIKVGL